MKITWIIFCVFALTGACAHAQAWKPEKNMEILIGLSAGSSQDRTGRMLQKIWQDAKLTPMSVNVVNRPSAGGQMALAVLAARAGDAEACKPVR